MLRLLIVTMGAIALAFVTTAAKAHEIRPTIVDFKLIGDDKFSLALSTNAEALIAKVGTQHDDNEVSPSAKAYIRLRALEPAVLETELREFVPKLLAKSFFQIEGNPVELELKAFEIPEVGDVGQPRISLINLEGTIPDGAKSFIWQWPAEFGQSVIRTNYKVKETDSPVGFSKFLREGEKSEPIPFEGYQVPFWEYFWQNVVYGFEHIIPLGLDHILFVVGLFLLSAHIGPLFWQITSFTVAHSVTLALGMLGIVNVAPYIVEPLIAASIVYVCIENIFTDKLQKWRPVIVFAFGLLHGLGFALVFTELGVTGGNFFAGLLAFNIGVEFGQLTVIAICFALVGYWFRDKPWYRERITIPVSMVIACIGAYWFYERVFV